MQQHFSDTESLAADPQFVAWVRAGKPAATGEAWEAWAAADPQRRRWMAEATELVEALRFPVTDPAPEVIDEEWARFLQASKTSVAPATPPEKEAVPPTREITRKPRRRWLIAATLLLLISTGLLWWLASPSVCATDYAERETIVLRDGTRVILHPNSILTVRQWDDGARSVSLDGQAFFEVARQPDRPFTVAAGEMTVTVLGTRFNLENRTGRQIVALEEGSVRLGTGADEDQTLAPGEVATFTTAARGLVKSRPASLETYVSWRDGYWKLESESLENIARRLTETFGVEVVFSDPALAGRKLSGTLAADELDVLLSQIGGLLDLSVTHEGGTVRF